MNSSHHPISMIRTALLALALALLSFSAVAAGRSVVDAAGRTVLLPAQPQRVLALSEIDLDSLLALKLKPVGATNGRGQAAMPRYLGNAVHGIASVGGFGSPVLDLVIAAQPDLILVGSMPDPQLLAQLGKIAPTAVSYRQGESWQVALRRIAAMVGRDAEAEAVLAAYQRRADSVRARLGGQADSTVSVVRWNPQGPAYMLKDAFASLVLADVKLRRPAAQMQAGVAHSPPLSLEALPRIDADWLFVGTLNTSQANDALAAARQSPAFRQLGAVRKGHMVAVDGTLWTSPGGPLAALEVLNDIEKAMLDKS
ncbi:ABC transporter substrate-binding protein [Janthinobacterium agaricidamnosum]|uniref:Periplasmic binding family protein n=1 Tax=Janthinobacterium agaricidamnosum NBRC 102515 = DSM 9628 TaxID=1349767 RepID=W0V7X0_9BURK|nr:iron-siderophore ABC transporter substrate-binding protein [Janthinobacterium agaricidamnosum]CDG83715.1 periplasmic binding family protein [Janthinobacterium agaricidamnosum NBRC 102515 = DSM 9628]